MRDIGSCYVSSRFIYMSHMFLLMYGIKTSDDQSESVALMNASCEFRNSGKGLNNGERKGSILCWNLKNYD